MLWVWYPNRSHPAIDFAPGVHLLQEATIYYTITSNDTTSFLTTSLHSKWTAEKIIFFLLFYFYFFKYVSQLILK